MLAEDPQIAQATDGQLGKCRNSVCRIIFEGFASAFFEQEIDLAGVKSERLRAYFAEFDDVSDLKREGIIVSR